MSDYAGDADTIIFFVSYVYRTYVFFFQDRFLRQLLFLLPPLGSPFHSPPRSVLLLPPFLPLHLATGTSQLVSSMARGGGKKRREGREGRNTDWDAFQKGKLLLLSPFFPHDSLKADDGVYSTWLCLRGVMLRAWHFFTFCHSEKMGRVLFLPSELSRVSRRFLRRGRRTFPSFPPRTGSGPASPGLEAEARTFVKKEKHHKTWSR